MEVEDLESGFLITIFAWLPSGMSCVIPKDSCARIWNPASPLTRVFDNPKQMIKPVGFHRGLLLE